MKVVVKNLENQDVGELTLNPVIFAVDIRQDILARVIHWQLMKRRSGTHKTKGISDISGTTRKPFKQKGTGRARQGSLRSPHMRGGAVIFGPVVRDHGFDLQKKVRRLGLRVALSSKMASGDLLVLDNLSSSGKTKDLSRHLKGLGLSSALFVAPDTLAGHFKRASAGLVGVDLLPPVGLNVYDIMRHKTLVLTKDVLPVLEERLA